MARTLKLAGLALLAWMLTAAAPAKPVLPVFPEGRARQNLTFPGDHAAHPIYRPIRPREVAYPTGADVVRFTSAEWEAKPEKIKAMFGFVSAEEVRKSIIGKQAQVVQERQERALLAQSRVDAAKQALEDGVLKLRQALQQAEADRDLQAAILARAQADHAQVEAQAQREVQALLGGSNGAPVVQSQLLAQPQDVNRKCGRR